MPRINATPDEVRTFQVEEKEEIRAKWFDYDNSSTGRQLQGEYLGLRKHRVEVAGFAAQEMGLLGDVIALETQIASRKKELEESGADLQEDKRLQELTSMLKVASRVCLLKVIDHPTMQRVMEYTHVRMQQIRALFMEKKNNRKHIVLDSDELIHKAEPSQTMRYMHAAIRKGTNASITHMNAEQPALVAENVPYSSVSDVIKPSLGGKIGPM